MSIIQVPRVINAFARLTRLGGSLMPPEVLEAMRVAAGAYVDLHAFQRACGERLAALTGNEAAYVCTGAAAGLFLTGLACAVGADPQAIARLPELGGKTELVLHRAHHIAYTPSLRLTGLRLVALGNGDQIHASQLEAVLSERTAAVVYVAGAAYARGVLPLPETIAIAHARGVPVIVDAAAQLPPVENLWRFTRELGADLAIFSGGKDLCGPQASGLIVGRADLIGAVAANGAPHQTLGRSMKVGKEEMAGLVAAVERYLTLDHAARLAGFERTVSEWGEALSDLPGLTAARSFPNEAGQPTPRLKLTIDPGVARLDAAALARALWDGDPRIAVDDSEPGAVYLTPDTLEPGEADIIVERLRALMGPLPRPPAL